MKLCSTVCPLAHPESGLMCSYTGCYPTGFQCFVVVGVPHPHCPFYHHFTIHSIIVDNCICNSGAKYSIKDYSIWVMTKLLSPDAAHSLAVLSHSSSSIPCINPQPTAYNRLLLMH